MPLAVGNLAALSKPYEFCQDCILCAGYWKFDALYPTDSRTCLAAAREFGSREAIIANGEDIEFVSPAKMDRVERPAVSHGRLGCFAIDIEVVGQRRAEFCHSPKREIGYDIDIICLAWKTVGA